MTPLLSALCGDAEVAAHLGDDAGLADMLAVERALAEASAEAQLISEDAAAAIASAIAAYSPDWAALRTGIARDGVVVPALLAQLRPLLPAAHRDALHKGATSQDIIDTALMLALSRILPLLLGRIDGIVGQLSVLARDHGTKPLMAHTRMQAALPTTWSAKLESWSAPLARHRQALAGMRESGLVVQLGGPVGDRASLSGHGDAIAAGLARRLGLGPAVPWHAARDRIVGLGGQLALLAGTLGKIGADIALLTQTELAALTLAGSGGSSAMAHKSNPVAAETVVALARYAAGLAGTLQQAMVHEYERSGAAWTLEWLTLPPLLETTGASLNHTGRLLAGMRIA